MRKKPKVTDETPSPASAEFSVPSLVHQQSTRDGPPLPFGPQIQHGPHYSSPYDPRFGWQSSHPPSLESPVTSNYSRSTEQVSPNMTSYPAPGPSQYLDPKIGPRVQTRESIAIASADLQNPSDALDILARVADRAEDDSGSGRGNTPRAGAGAKPWAASPSPLKMNGHIYYKPLNDGLVHPELVYELFREWVPTCSHALECF